MPQFVTSNGRPGTMTRVERDEEFRDHVIVCGLGHLGRRIVQLLRALPVRVTVITQSVDRDWYEASDLQGVKIVHGDARDSRLLAEAKLGEAKALIVATDQDLTNIEIALDARKMAPHVPLVVRIFDQRLANSLEQSFGIRRALAMSAIAAPLFASASIGDLIAGTFSIEDRRFVAVRNRAPSPGLLGLHGISLLLESEWRKGVVGHSTKANAPRGNGVRSGVRFFWSAWSQAPRSIRAAFAILLAIVGISIFFVQFAMKLPFIDAAYFVVTTVTTTGYGGITPKDASAWLKLFACLVMILGSAVTALLYSLFTDFIVAERFRGMMEAARVAERDHVVVVGIGNVGYRATEALSQLGIAVAAIDASKDAPLLAEARTNAPVLVGDARFRGVLERAGIAQAKAIACTTGNDVVNLEIALAAKSLNKDIQTIIRLFDPTFASKVEGSLAISRALSGSMLAAPMFVAAALHERVLSAFIHDRSLIVLFQSTGAAQWDGLSVRDVKGRFGVDVVLTKRDGKFGPASDTEILRSGTACVVAHGHALAAPATVGSGDRF